MQSTCPFCRTEIDHGLLKRGLPDADEIQEQLKHLDAYCPFQEIGCEWIGKRSALHRHLKVGCPQFQGNVNLVHKSLFQ